MPADVFANLVEGEAPFDGINVALVSHLHGDHFQPDAARAFLDRHAETLFVSSPQVVDAVGGAAEGRQAVSPEPGEVVSVERGGVRVAVFRLPQAGHFSPEEDPHCLTQPSGRFASEWVAGFVGIRIEYRDSSWDLNILPWVCSKDRYGPL